MSDKRTYKIQLRYKDGAVVNYVTITPPVSEFVLPTKSGGQAHFEVFLTLIKCGEDIEIQKVYYKEKNTI